MGFSQSKTGILRIAFDLYQFFHHILNPGARAFTRHENSCSQPVLSLIFNFVSAHLLHMMNTHFKHFLWSLLHCVEVCNQTKAIWGQWIYSKKNLAGLEAFGQLIPVPAILTHIHTPYSHALIVDLIQ